MSTQEKVHGLGLRVPDLIPYASGSCIPCEGDGAPAVVKVGVALDWLSHTPQVLLQFALHSKMKVCRPLTDRTLRQSKKYTSDSPQSEYSSGKLLQSLCECCRWPHNQERYRRGGDGSKVVRLSRGRARSCNQE